MRVTNKMLSNNFLNDMRTNLEHMKTLQEQMTSGKEIRRPSDDPFKVARTMQLNTDINTNKQYNDNIKDTLNWLDVTDTALGQAGNVLQRVRELLVSAGNAGYGPSERKAVKDEINQKIGEFAQIANTSFDNKYIFGGGRGDVKPLATVNNATAQTSEVVALNGAVNTATLDVSSAYTGNVDATYLVKATEVDSTGKVTKVQFSKDNGTTWSSDLSDSLATPDPNKTEFDLGDGLKLDFKTDSNSKLNNSFIFTATAANTAANTKLVYYSDNSSKPELPALNPPTQNLQSGQKNYEYMNIGIKLNVEISQGVTMDYNVSAKQLLQFQAKRKDGTMENYDLRDLLNKIVNHLDGKSDDGSVDDADAVSKLTGDDLQGIQNTIDNLLKLRSEVGAKQNRMDSAKDKNEQENYSMTDILSKTEDIDITQKTMEYSTMQTVYMASLQTSAKVLQPSLIDYLR